MDAKKYRNLKEGDIRLYATLKEVEEALTLLLTSKNSISETESAPEILINDGTDPNYKTYDKWKECLKAFLIGLEMENIDTMLIEDREPLYFQRKGESIANKIKELINYNK